MSYDLTEVNAKDRQALHDYLKDLAKVIATGHSLAGDAPNRLIHIGEQLKELPKR